MSEDAMRKALVHWRTTIDGRPTSAEAFAAGWQAATRAAVPAWQPIETAPKDGTNVLLLNRAGNMACGMWMESRGLGTGWFLRGGGGPDLFFNYHHGPTHWMPLPNPPEVPA